MQSLAVVLLCKWSETDADFREGQKAAANLLGHVYITAGKVQAGNAWRKTIEGLVASAHQLVGPIVSTMVEGEGKSGKKPITYSIRSSLEAGSAAGLAPLDLPPLEQAISSLDQTASLHAALQRLDALVFAIKSMLRSVLWEFMLSTCS